MSRLRINGCACLALCLFFAGPVKLSGHKVWTIGHVTSVDATGFRLETHWWRYSVIPEPDAEMLCGGQQFDLTNLRVGDVVELNGYGPSNDVHAVKIKVRRKKSKCASN